jgi:single-strand DNA-binding protein
MSMSTRNAGKAVRTLNAVNAVNAVNEVRLVGRVSTAPTSRELPSGDRVTLLRVVVDRPAAARRPRAPSVDTVECALWTAALRRRAERLPPGAQVEVQGALRRRFWRTPGGPASRYEVEVSALRRLPAARGVGDGLTELG